MTCIGNFSYQVFVILLISIYVASYLEKKKKNTTFLILYDRYLCQSLRKGVKRKNFYVICYFLSLFVIVGFYGALCKYRKNIKLVNYDWDCALSNV